MNTDVRKKNIQDWKLETGEKDEVQVEQVQQGKDHQVVVEEVEAREVEVEPYHDPNHDHDHHPDLNHMAQEQEEEQPVEWLKQEANSDIHVH